MSFQKKTLLLGLIVLISFVFYLGWSWFMIGFGFPLDDAWIHQTYARNFGHNFQWGFLPDHPSGGSTGPLWGMLLSLLYLLNIPPLWGTYLYGFLFLWGTSVTGLHLFEKIAPENKTYKYIAGALLAVEWHLIWSALSGMETILLIFLSLILFNFLLEKKDNWIIPGIIIGLSVWVRPDGMTLFGPAVLCLVLRSYSVHILLKKAALFGAGFILLFGPYILFNWLVSGDIWPNTFYAKQAEYSILRQANLVGRYLKVGFQFITGIGVLLLPGIYCEIRAIVNKKNWENAALVLWSVGYVGLYAWRLPVTYQHGRYIIPAMPIGFLFGISGLLRWVDLQSEKLWQRVLSGVWIGAAIAVTASFWIVGARAYALDVAVIETEMVKVAEWIEENTDEDAVIAAHDIGAIGYFSTREIVDLAGLITPDVIPFIRNEQKLAYYIDQENADYLVSFPDWYPVLTQKLIPVYQSNSPYSTLFDMENMVIFLWK